MIQPVAANATHSRINSTVGNQLAPSSGAVQKSSGCSTKLVTTSSVAHPNRMDRAEINKRWRMLVVI